jgi:G3E family GTPase
MRTLAQENSHSHLPISMITGFLGSGKTTLLNQLLHQPEMQQTLVIVNEFGEIGIDHLLVKATTEEMMLLEGGCVCCSVRTDLATTLEEAFHKRERQEIEFKQILIETTGLADPAPILRTLIDDAFITSHYRLETLVTTVDALHGSEQLDEYDESVKQAALAHHLILTKIDLVDVATLQVLKQRIQRFNPTATIHEVNFQKDTLNADKLFNTTHYNSEKLDVSRWLNAETYLEHQQAIDEDYRHDEQPPHRHDRYIKTFCIEHTEPLHWLTLERWIQQLTKLRGKDLLRVKGIAYTYETDLPVIIQGVQHVFQPPTTLEAWPSETRRTQIVFITRNIEKTIVERVLHTLIKSKTPIEACQAALILIGQEYVQ